MLLKLYVENERFAWEGLQKSHIRWMTGASPTLTFVSDVQPSHTCGMSIAPLSSRLPTFSQNVDPSQLILQFSKRANGVRGSNVRFQSVTRVTFSPSPALPWALHAAASKQPPLSHFGISRCSLSGRSLVFKTGQLAKRCQDFAEK